MHHISWKDRYNIGYKEIDDQHRGLVGLLNELAEFQNQEVTSEQLADIFHRLCQYALTHFATEERYMAAAGYPGLATHQAEHASFIQDLLGLNQSYEPGDPRLVEATFTFVKEWYLRHIIQSDLDYVATLKSYRTRARIRGIIFDLSVICEIHEMRFLEAAAPLCGRTVQELQTLIEEEPSLGEGYERGELNTYEFISRFSELCGHPFSEHEFIQAYAKVFTARDPLIEVVRRLKPRCKLGLTAITTPLRLEHGLSFEVQSLFEAVTLPRDITSNQPGPSMFQDILDKLDLLAEECLYVTTQPAFALAASGYLLHGLVATSAESLEAGLRRLNLEI
jgi:hemerythrin